jgi:hypothetical protein
MNDEQIKQLMRRLDSIEKTQKIQFDDRNILEDILLKVADLTQQTKLLVERVEKLEKLNRADNKDILEEVQQVRDQVENLGGD